MPPFEEPTAGALARAAREIVTRAVAAVGLAGIALIHLLDSLGKFQETPYMGWMYVGLIVACLAAAGALLRANLREAWLAAVALIQFYSGRGFVSPQGLRACGTGTFADPNDTALALVPALPLALIALLDGRRALTRLAAAAAIGLLLWAIYLTNSRGGMLALGGTLPRAGKWLAQTPQMFRIGLLARALDAAGEAVTDEASAIEALGLQPRLVRGSAQNFKVTWPEDFALAEAVLTRRSPA